jgi:2-amino-4-hydroxy-6-hydroxymethyldihydropteridine diphosphokinase
LSNRYLIALGSNRRHHRFGSPRQVLRAAMAALKPERTSPIITTAPIGPSQRRYANAALVLRSSEGPEALLARLKAIEAGFGRRSGGQRWASRVLDLDIILWSQGCWSSPGLTIPHTQFRARSFVLTPAAQIARCWRDPVTCLTLHHLQARLTRNLPLPKRAPSQKDGVVRAHSSVGRATDF